MTDAPREAQGKKTRQGVDGWARLTTHSRTSHRNNYHSIFFGKRSLSTRGFKMADGINNCDQIMIELFEQICHIYLKGIFLFLNEFLG